METVTRDVRELGALERSAAEQLVGHSLSDQHRLVIQVIGISPGADPLQAVADELPSWCNVYEGLTDDQVAEIEKSIVRCNLSRPVE